jgi:hypothetical protein
MVAISSIISLTHLKGQRVGPGHGVEQVPPPLNHQIHIKPENEREDERQPVDSYVAVNADFG